MRIYFIGGGHMGEAIIAALLKNKTCSPADIAVKEVLSERREYLHQKYGIRVTASGKEAVNEAGTIVMSVKPQTLPEVLAELGGVIRPQQLVLSIMAGVKISTLRNGLKHQSIVRSMPNTPAQIGMGMTVWTATPDVSGSQKETARSILATMGQELFVDEEQMIDKATAVHGSGPAYLFLFVEAFIDAAIEIGIPRQTAQQLVLQTVIGAGNLIAQSGKEPAELRRMVTSRGGTTEAALEVFQEGDFNRLVARAIAAAYQRSRELGGEKVR